jgi:phosphate/sulfate permease
MGAMSGFHSGMHGGSLLIILGAWAIVGILGLIIKAIISSMYPENINKESTKSDMGSTKNSSNSFSSNTDGKD